MGKLTSLDDMLNKAFVLAYFIHGDREVAVRIVSDAMAKLDVAATAQGKRSYYQPGARSLLPRSRSMGFRTKVTFSELHLLQRLVYIESEAHEKHKEQLGAAIGKEELLIHFIKHLVRITLKRNSFYVTLGISRLLYNYTTQEAMGIYNVVVQDPERVKDDYYYRSRKGVLMQEIKERFGDLVKISHGQRGEERFQAEPEPGRFAELVGECLSFFTPWATPCLIPAGFDPISDSIPSFQFESRDNEDQIELNRIHVALHPNCYQRLINALGFHSPDQRLEVPCFFLSNENGDRNHRGRPGLELGPEDLNTIKNDLGELAERRRKSSTGLWRILVDGVDHNQVDLKHERSVRLNLDQNPELIEIWTTDETGELLLASYLPTYQRPETAEPLRGSTFIANGQKVSIVVSPSTDSSRPVVDISYEETAQNKTSAVSQWLFDRYQFAFGGIGYSRFLIPALSFLFLIILTGIVVRYSQRGTPPSRPPQVANNNETGSPARAEGGPVIGRPDGGSNTPTVPSDKGREAGKQQPSAAQSARNSTGPLRPEQSIPQPQRDPSVGQQSEGLPSQRETTRGSTNATSAVSLLQMKSVYVESGQGSSDQTLARMLTRKLQTSGRFTLSKTRDEADALFKVTTRPFSSNPRNRTQTGRESSVVIVNASGEVIWPLKGGRSRGRYEGSNPEQVSNQILKDLFEDIERLMKQP